MRATFPLSLVFLLAAGCATQGAVTSVRHVDPNAGRDCVAHCDVLGMRLSAVVVIMDSTGCVCEPRDRTSAAAPEHGAAAVAAGVVIAAASQAANPEQPVQPPAPAAP